mmetsp:Transcript_38833/g.88306  ORF Transcript_38833/g.88306 Transcript_38833/m.88306 type:complete len:322 (-) Transcript_38833:77-1042(-)
MAGRAALQFPAAAMNRAWASLPSISGRRDRTPPSRSPHSFTSEAIPEDAVLIGGNIPGYFGQDIPDESGIMGQVKRSVPTELHRASFQDKLTFFMLLVLGMPTISCVLLSRHPSVIYWMGRSGFLIPIGVMAWVLLGHDLLVRRILKRRLAVVIVLVFPITVLLVTAHVHKLRTVDLHARLMSKDCTSFPGKARLEQAWQGAKAVFDKCVGLQANETGAPIRELEQVTSVSRCLGYEVGQNSWGKEWAYLEELEREQRCAGWCTMEAPLWHNMVDYKPHDRCSLAVANMMGGEVYRTARQIVFYCFSTLAFLAVFFSIIEF